MIAPWVTAAEELLHELQQHSWLIGVYSRPAAGGAHEIVVYGTEPGRPSILPEDRDGFAIVYVPVAS